MNASRLQTIPSPKVDDALLQEIVEKIVAAFHPRRIILFGSRARGDYYLDSDLDLFVEMETNLHPVERRTQIRSLFQPQKCAMDILVYTPEEVQRRKNSLVSLVPVIEEEGKVLYDRSSG